MSDRLNAISPLDGRYGNAVKNLSAFFSESALMRFRLKVEIEYLIAIGNEKRIHELGPFSTTEQTRLREIYKNFNSAGAEKVKEIEATTNHDVKAIEYYIQDKVKMALHPWIHFALTSEDVNNLSYSLMWKDGLQQAYLSTLQLVNKELKKLARKYKKSSMLALTHGQPATPTTLGKELAVFCARLDRQIKQIKAHKFLGKFGGATGTWSAHVVAYPKTNWKRFAERLIKSLGLEPNMITTQIEPHDSLAESYHQIIRVNSVLTAVLTGLCRDMWSYISRGILAQKKISGEVGSSTMPHKINPIQFENAEGNLCLSSSLLTHLAAKLTISRMQRDLSDSTTLRNQGVALGYSYLALRNISKGLGRITIDKSKLTQELDNHWEVLAEAIQTILRKSGNPDAYEQLKEIVRGQSITAETVTGFISLLKISNADKKVLMNLTPESYIGLAPKLVDLI